MRTDDVPLPGPKALTRHTSFRLHSASEEQRTDRHVRPHIFLLALFCFFISLYFILYFLRSRWAGGDEKAAQRVRQSRRAMIINVHSRSICAGLCCFIVSRELKFNHELMPHCRWQGVSGNPAGTPMVTHNPPPSALKQLFPPLPPPPPPIQNPSKVLGK